MAEVVVEAPLKVAVEEVEVVVTATLLKKLPLKHKPHTALLLAGPTVHPVRLGMKLLAAALVEVAVLTPRFVQLVVLAVHKEAVEALVRAALKMA